MARVGRPALRRQSKLHRDRLDDRGLTSAVLSDKYGYALGEFHSLVEYLCHGRYGRRPPATFGVLIGHHTAHWTAIANPGLLHVHRA